MTREEIVALSEKATRGRWWLHNRIAELERENAELREALKPFAASCGIFPLGTRVRKRRPPEWQGRVCGYYSTSHNPEGIVVESEREKLSVQVYPASALEPVPEETSHGE